MTHSEATASTPALRGRERACAQCGAMYRSPRASLYCSNACRCRAKRGLSPKACAPTGTATFSPIGRLLLKLGFAGPIGRGGVYGLTVPADYALAEMRLVFDRKGWGQVTDGEFAAALSADGIRRFSSDSPEAADRARLLARQRAATRPRQRP